MDRELISRELIKAARELTGIGVFEHVYNGMHRYEFIHHAPEGSKSGIVSELSRRSTMAFNEIRKNLEKTLPMKVRVYGSWLGSPMINAIESQDGIVTYKVSANLQVLVSVNIPSGRDIENVVGKVLRVQARRD